MQEIWLSGLNGDEPLTNELTTKIRSWFGELHEIHEVKILRCLQLKAEPVGSTLHLFCHASQDAYAAIAYARSEYVDGSVSIRMIASKSKVAPLKAVSVPRLELIGATLSVRLASTITNVLKYDSVYYWTDSMNVLWWITRRSRTLKTCVANRIAKIQRDTETMQWRHVKTKENPVDPASRGISVNELANCELWWHQGMFAITPCVRGRGSCSFMCCRTRPVVAITHCSFILMLV